MANNAGNQRRTLWIMAAAGIFLLVVIGAAVILYSPAINKEQDRTVISDPNAGWNDAGIDELGLSDDEYFDANRSTDAPDSPFESNESSGEVFTLNLDEITPKDSSTENTSTSSSDKMLEGSVFASDSESKSSDNVVQLDNGYKSNVSAKNDYTASKIESAKTEKSSSKSTSSISRDSNTTKVVTTSSTNKAIYWVQVGSFEDKNKADNARAILEKNGYTNSSVFTYKEGSTIMYRVRIGSYDRKADAEAIMEKVSKIKPFTNNSSYVVNSNAPAVKK